MDRVAGSADGWSVFFDRLSSVFSRSGICMIYTIKMHNHFSD
jgi:hypothetical protein